MLSCEVECDTQTVIMILPADKERVQTLLKDTITLLCKNGLTFHSEFSVEALIGITLDKEDIFLVNINENIKCDTSPEPADIKATHDMIVSDGSTTDNNTPVSQNRTRKRLAPRTSELTNSTTDHVKAERDVWGQASITSFDSSTATTAVSSQDVSYSEPPAAKRNHLSNSSTPHRITDVNHDVIQVKSEAEESWDEESDDGNGEELAASYDSSCFREASLSHITGNISANSQPLLAENSDKYQHQRAETATDSPYNTTIQLHGSGSEDSKQHEQIRGVPNLDLVASMYNDMIGQSQQLLQRGGVPSASWSPSVTKHVTAGHSESSNASSAGAMYLPYPCQICGKRYLKRDGLVRHLKTHDTSLHRCKRCTLFFPSEELLNQHMTSRHSSTSLKHACPICGKRFDRPFILRKHMQTHENSLERPLD